MSKLYYINIKNNYAYKDLINTLIENDKIVQDTKPLLTGKECSDLFENFNENLNVRLSPIFKKIFELKKKLLIFDKLKKYKILDEFDFFNKFNLNIFLINVNNIFEIALSHGNFNKSIIKFTNKNISKNLKKDELINSMMFFHKYNSNNSEISNYIKSLNEIEYMIVSLFSYIKINIDHVLYILIEKRNISTESDLIKAIINFREKLLEIYIYINVIIEEIIIQNSYLRNKYDEIHNIIEKIYLNDKDIYLNLNKRLQLLISYIIYEINQYFSKYLF